MASYQPIVNPFTGKMTLIRSDSAFHLKDNVATYNDLPLTGNAENDVRITADDDKMYTWGIASPSGLITDWKVIGSSSSVDWSAITGKPSSTPAEIDSAVGVEHIQGTDQKLDEGGVNEVAVADVKDAVDKKHTQNTDTGTDNASFNINNEGLEDGISLTHDETISYSDDICEGGTPSAQDFWGGYPASNAFDGNESTYWYGTGGPPQFPNWLKYDFGSGNEKTVIKLRIKSLYNGLKNGYFQGSNDDSSWDNLYTFTNESTSTAWKDFTFTNTTAYRYYRVYFSDAWNTGVPIGIYEVEMMEASILSDALRIEHGDGSEDLNNIIVKNLSASSFGDSSGSNVSTPANIKDAVDKKHTQGTDQKLDEGGANEVAVADVKDAVDKKHTQGTDEDIIIDSTPDSDHTASGIKSTFTAGENVAFGDVCYVKSDGKMWKGDANSDSTASVVVMALETISADASGSFLLIGIARDDSWAWTVGALLYLSGTAGALTETAPSSSGDQVQILGVATHADRIYFKPELVQVEIT